MTDATLPAANHPKGRTPPAPGTSDVPDALVLCSQADGVATLTLNRPARMNALNVALLLELADKLERLNRDGDVGAIILAGAQGHFSTGADLKDTAPGPNGELRLDVLHRCFNLLTQVSKPTLAAVSGNAYGAGLSFALACDYIIAAKNARFCAPFTGIGLIPDTGLVYTLPLRIGMGRARRMMYEGLVVDAEQAHDWGMVELVTDNNALLESAHAVARTLLKRAPLALSALRGLLSRQWPDPQKFLQEERRIQQRLLATDDVQEARLAFAEKRPPRFCGR